MITYEQYVETFKECSRIATSADSWDYKVINKNHNKMKNIVRKMYELKREESFFNEIFSSEERCVLTWGACFSEIFNYDLKKSYELFLEESQSTTARSIDIMGAKIAVERLKQKLKITD